MGKDVRTIGIVGTGMIATSMAVLGTGHGFRTYVLVRSDASRLRCEKNYDEAFAAMAEKGLITADQIAVCKSYLHFTMEYADMAEAEAIFECVVEDLDTKHEVYRKIEENCPKVKGIGSVSSSIVPELLAEGIEKYGDRIIVTHPFNPAHMVPYFELCAGEKTNPDVLPYLNNLDRTFDIMVLDPPAFAKNHRSLQQGLKGYKNINQRALEKIAPGGLLFTFSCSQAVSKEDFQTMLFTAAAFVSRGSVRLASNAARK